MITALLLILGVVALYVVCDKKKVVAKVRDKRKKVADSQRREREDYRNAA